VKVCPLILAHSFSTSAWKNRFNVVQKYGSSLLFLYFLRSLARVSGVWCPAHLGDLLCIVARELTSMRSARRFFWAFRTFQKRSVGPVSRCTRWPGHTLDHERARLDGVTDLDRANQVVAHDRWLLDLEGRNLMVGCVLVAAPRSPARPGR